MTSHNLTELVWKHFDGLITEDEAAQLVSLLAGNEENIASALQLAELHRHMRDVVLERFPLEDAGARSGADSALDALNNVRPGAGVSGIDDPGVERTAATTIAFWWRSPWVVTPVSVGALLLLLFMLGMLNLPGAAQRPNAPRQADANVQLADGHRLAHEGRIEAVATITGEIDSVWGDVPTAGSAIRGYGAVLQKGDVCRLESGVVQLTFEGGAKVVVQGPAEFVVSSAMSGVLSEGKLAAVVPVQASGFTVRTPLAEIVDLGTKFGVDVNQDTACDVHVFDGEVIVRRLDDSGEPVGDPYRVSEQSAVQFSLLRRTAHMARYNQDKFIRQVEPQLSGSELPPLPVTSDLLLWLAADVLVKTADNGAVVAWRDILVGDNQSAEDATQTFSESRPRWVPDAIHGKPAIRFDGLASMVTARFANADNQSVFLVFQFMDDVDARKDTRYQLINYNGPPRHELFDFSTQGVLQIAEFPHGTGDLSGFVFSVPGGKNLETGVVQHATLPAKIPVALSYIYDWSAREASLYSNGRHVNTAEAVISAATVSRKVIGRHGLVARFFRGDIAEIIIYDRALADEERAAVETYLIDKYGLRLSET